MGRSRPEVSHVLLGMSSSLCESLRTYMARSLWRSSTEDIPIGSFHGPGNQAVALKATQAAQPRLNHSGRSSYGPAFWGLVTIRDFQQIRVPFAAVLWLREAFFLLGPLRPTSLGWLVCVCVSPSQSNTPEQVGRFPLSVSLLDPTQEKIAPKKTSHPVCIPC